MNPEQIKEIQLRLQSKGLYQGDIDGKMGPGTARAMALERQMAPQKSDAEIQLERERLAAEQAAQERKAQQQREESSDPLMEQFAPFGAGLVAGAGYGELANRGLNAYERGNVQALKEISDELGPTRDLTSSQLNRSRAAGAARAAERFAPTGVNRLLNVTGRGLSYGIPAGAIYNEYQNYQSRADEAKTESERIANQQIANGLLGGATGIAVEGGRRFFFPSRDAGLGEAQMRIETARDFANRMDANDARAVTAANRPASEPAASAPAPKRQNLPGSRADLLSQAKRYDIKGRSKMTTEQLRSAVSDAVKGTPAPRGGAATKMLKSPAFAPIIAGATAAGAAYNDARAAGESPVEAATSAADDAALAGGATAAGVYGANRLLSALPQVAKTAAGVGAAGGVAPDMISSMTDYSPSELNTARNWAARNLPESLQFGAIDTARQMAEVPDPSPMRGAEPEDFDTQMADLDRLLQEMDAEGAASPQRAVRSARVAAMPVMAPFEQNRLLMAR